MVKKCKVVIVPETHWDRAWDCTFQQYRIRLVKCVDKLIQIMNNDHRYKSFTFDGQTVILEDYLQIRPEMERELKRLIQNDRIIVGPWYTLADEFLVSPEALVRNLMIGHMIAESFGKVMKVGYVPDAFGHISQLPQILQGFSIDSAIFQRGVGDEGEILGSEFQWCAPDGKTSVLAIHQVFSYCNAVNLGYVGMDGGSPLLDLDNAVERTRQLVDAMKPYARTSNILFNNGCDLSEPQPELADIIEYVNENLNSVEMILGTFADYLERVRAEEPKLEKYRGELRNGRYQLILPGVFSSRMYMKQANEATQTLMERWVEPFSALNWLETEKAYPRAFIWYAWKELIKNHPHDDICGCSIDEVHRDDMTRYGWVQQIGEELTRKALESLAENINFPSVSQLPLVVFNPLAWLRQDPVSVGAIHELPLPSKIPENLVVKNLDGKIVPTQITPKDGGVVELTFQGEVPALGYATFFLSSSEDSTKKGSRQTSTIKTGPRMMENKFYRISISTDGTLDILDKSTGFEYKGCNLYEDTEDAGDEYDYSPAERSKTITSKGLKANVRITENGAIKTTVEIKLSMNLPRSLTKDRKTRTASRLSCPIITRVTIYANIPRIDFAVSFENKVEDHRFRVVFPTDIKTDVAHVEGHFDVVTRALDLPKPKAKWAQDPVPTNHQNAFIDIDNGERGFAVINKGLPEYEVRKTKNGCNIYLTLLRCVGWLSRGDLLTRQCLIGSAPKATPEAQCPGTHIFFYSIIPHKGDWVSAQVQRRAHEHNVPMKVIRPNFVGVIHELPSVQSFISVEPSNLIVTALKKCELGEGLILRFYNATAKTVNGIIKTHRPVKSARLTNLNEQPLDNGNLNVEADGAISLEAGGREIKTVELAF